MLNSTPTPEKVESYLIENEMRYEMKGNKTFHVFDDFEDAGDIFIYADDPQILVKAKVCEIKHPTEKLYKRLLELNNDLAYGAYALDDNYIMWFNTLTSKTLDEEELINTIEAFELAIVEHYQIIKELL